MKNFRNVIRKGSLEKTNKALVMLFVLFLIGSILFSPSPILGIYYLIKIIEFIFLGLCIFLNRNKFINLIPRALPYSIIFESVLTLLQFIHKGSINGLFYFFGERTFNSQTPQIANTSINGELILRPYATFPHPNVLGAFLVFSIIFVLLSINFGKSKITKATLFSFMIAIPALILTFSRSAILVFVISMVLIIGKKYAEGKKTINYMISLAVIIGTILLTNIRFRFIPNFSDSSFIDRKDLILAGIKMIERKPLFGVGLNNFLPELPKYFSGSEKVFYVQPVHNILILAISQIGFLAAGIIIYFLYLVFKKTNFWGRILIFDVFLFSMVDHYFLTIQQGQTILTIAISLSVILVQNDRIKSYAQGNF